MINSYTSWQPLEEVIVGRAYPPDYFDFISNAQVRNQLQQILAETEEDLDNLQRTIETYGARVRRPTLIDRQHFENLQINSNGAPLPPLTPRDWQISLGQKLLRVLPIAELNDICAEYQDQVVDPHKDWAQTNQFHANSTDLGDPNSEAWNPDCILNGASASCIVRVGRDVFFDNSDFLKPEQSAWITKNVLGPEYRVHEAVTDGHGDAVFAILKPGVLLSSKHDVNLDLARDFPGWDVLKIWDSSIWAAMEVGKFKWESNPGAWYVQGQTPTPEFTDFVNTYLNKWTGFVAETVFDVNCLVLDEENVIFSAYNKEVFDYCRKHRINPIISELRHSYFWDGGISCCTQDLQRRGGLETYL
jgi:glycine amidinotransferase/scyllo-inosamine-4-phosphate amidinotransferase 1